MAVITIGNYYAEWVLPGDKEDVGCGRIILRSAHQLTDLYYLKNLAAEDFNILLKMLQTEKPIFWDTHANCLRTAHPQSHDAEPVGEQEAS
jgi:hypothetical protein